MGITILHHLGLGDQIMLNGMIRHFSERDRVTIFIKRYQYESVSFMYRDIDVNIICLDSVNPHTMRSLIPEGDTIIPLATYRLPDQTWNQITQTSDFMTNWAHGVYIQAGVNPLYMYTKFRVDRDHERENALFDVLAPKEKYIFMHDDPSRDRVYEVPTDLKIFKPGGVCVDKINEFFKNEHDNIFDYLKIIENAEEVHCINSSYNWIIELMKIGHKHKNFFHTDVAHKYYCPSIVKTVFSDSVWTFIDESMTFPQQCAS